jgi:hypothetical protein
MASHAVGLPYLQKRQVRAQRRMDGSASGEPFASPETGLAGSRRSVSIAPPQAGRGTDCLSGF